MKTCASCKVPLPLSEFWNHYTGKDGKRSRCKKCLGKEHKQWGDIRAKRDPEYNRRKVREWRARNPERKRDLNLKRRYGINMATYESLLKKQNGVCAICRLPPLEGKSLYVDHDHKTGKIRGLLHNRCNRALGFLNEDPAIIRRALDYLKN